MEISPSVEFWRGNQGQGKSVLMARTDICWRTWSTAASACAVWQGWAGACPNFKGSICLFVCFCTASVCDAAPPPPTCRLDQLVSQWICFYYSFFLGGCYILIGSLLSHETTPPPPPPNASVVDGVGGATWCLLVHCCRLIAGQAGLLIL